MIADGARISKEPVKGYDCRDSGKEGEKGKERYAA